MKRSILMRILSMTVGHILKNMDILIIEQEGMCMPQKNWIDHLSNRKKAPDFRGFWFYESI